MYVGQNPSFGSRDRVQTSFFWSKLSSGVTLKMRSRSPKSNHFFPPPPNNAYVQVKIHPLVHEIECREEATPTPMGSAPPTPLRLGDIISMPVTHEIKSYYGIFDGGGGCVECWQFNYLETCSNSIAFNLTTFKTRFLSSVWLYKSLMGGGN